MRLLAALAPVLLAVGCAQTTLFRAAEKATAISPAGYTAADYDLVIAGRDFGEAKVWSNGAYVEEYLGKERTVVHVGFEIENHSRAPFTLDRQRLALDSTLVGTDRIADVHADRVAGVTEVPPNGTRRVDAYFYMPEGVDPEDVLAFRVRWALEDRLGISRPFYAQRTPFLEAPYAYYALSPYNNPYYGI